MTYPICHLLVLGSACFNPLLYGWLNDNFRREFIKALCCCSKTMVTAGDAATTGAARANGARSVAHSAGVRPSRRCRRRPSQIVDDIELGPCNRDAEHVDESVNDPDQLVSLVDK